MPYILIKGEIGFDNLQYSSIFLKGDEIGVRQSLRIREQSEPHEIGFNVQTLAGSILNALQLQGWKVNKRNHLRDGVFSVQMSAGSILNTLELQGWKLEAVNGPDADDGNFTFTLRKGGC